MKYNDLLMESKAWLQKKPACVSVAFSAGIFSTGAKWMHARLNEQSKTKTELNTSINFGRYGLLKYGTCIAVSFVSALLLYKVSIMLVPLSIIIFYCCEVQFLFLFPLLADNVENPLWTSIRQTWRMGIWKTVGTVIPISIFMLAGLFNFKAPFRNWYLGCLAIIIWYQYEVRNKFR